MVYEQVISIAIAGWKASTTKNRSFDYLWFSSYKLSKIIPTFMIFYIDIVYDYMERHNRIHASDGNSWQGKKKRQDKTTSTLLTRQLFNLLNKI